MGGGGVGRERAGRESKDREGGVGGREREGERAGRGRGRETESLKLKASQREWGERKREIDTERDIT